MTEYIDKAELLRETICKGILCSECSFNDDVKGARCKLIRYINELLTTDVVHCSECRRWERKEDTKYGFCHDCQYGYLSDRWTICIERKTEEDHYCANGERRK